MSGDNNPNNVAIPAVFLFNIEGEQLLKHMAYIEKNEKTNIRAILMSGTKRKGQWKLLNYNLQFISKVFKQHSFLEVLKFLS